MPAVVNKEVTYAEAYSRSQTEIRKAVPLAEELGVKIAIENVWNQFLLSHGGTGVPDYGKVPAAPTIIPLS